MAIDSALGRLGIKQGVCTSSTRPTNPFEGQVIYESDTNRTLVYDNAAWVVVADNQVLSIDAANGRVGIGTDTPEANLDINGNTPSLLFTSPTDTNRYRIDANISDAADYGLSLGYWDGAAYQRTLTVDDTGKVGIGTTSPTGMLHVSGSDPKIWLTDTDTNADSFVSAQSSVGSLVLSADENNEVAGSQIAFKVDGTTYMGLDGSGRLTINSQPSVFAFSPGTDQVGGGTTPTKVQFNNTQHNIGGHYSTSNDRFTCPVAGEYLVSWYGVGGSADTVYRYYLRINGSTWNDYHVRANGTYDGYSRTDVLSLNQNDYLEIWFNSDNGSAQYTSGGNTYYTFSVRLLG